MNKTAYTIRDIDPSLWRKVKIRAATEGIPIRTLIIRLLTAETEGGKNGPEK